MPSNDVSRILQALGEGDVAVRSELLNLIYQELHQMATRQMAQESPGHSLQATALVHEAYLRLFGTTLPVAWQGRSHFFGAAAEAMRRILVESARRKGRLKHGGGRIRVEVADIAASRAIPRDEILELDKALHNLAEESEEMARLVELRYFCGLTHEQVSQTLGISEATAKRRWRYAQAWLRREMQPEKNLPKNSENTAEW